MPLATYDELVASVTSWLARADLEPQVPDFIRLAEASLSRRLRVSEMEAGIVSSTTVADRVFLPADFVELGYFFFSGQKPPTYLSREIFAQLLSGTGGLPKYFTFHGGTATDGHLHLWPEPGVGVDYVISWFHAIPALSSGAPTNWLLARHPDLYLFAALLEAEPFLHNDERVALWQARVDKAVASANGVDRRMRSSGGQNRMVLT